MDGHGWWRSALSKLASWYLLLTEGACQSREHIYFTPAKILVCNWMFGISSSWCLLSHRAGWPEERVLEGPNSACAGLLVHNLMNRPTAPRTAADLYYTGVSPSKHSKAPTEQGTDPEISSLVLLHMKQGERGKFDHVCKIRVMAHHLSVPCKLWTFGISDQKFFGAVHIIIFSVCGTNHTRTDPN